LEAVGTQRRFLETMDEFDQTYVADLIGHIYEAAVHPGHWHEFVALLERIHPDSRVTLFGHENGRPSPALTVHRNFASDDLRAYVEHHVKSSPYIARASKLPVGRPILSEVMITDAELKATEHFHEYVRPRRLGHYAAGVILDRRGGGMTALSMADQKNDEARRSRQVRLLEILTPHLQRALKLHRTLVAERESEGAARAAFDRWAHPALVLNPQSRVVTMNRAAELLLRRPDGLWVGRDGVLRSADDEATRALGTAVRNCAMLLLSQDSGVEAADIDGISLPRRSGAAALRAMIWPLPFLGGSPAEFGAGAVLMVIFDPDQVHRTPVAWIARQFGLTPSEQRLTEAIVNGVPLSEAAEQLGIRLSTARTRLKTVQTKTQCHRQLDLVRLAHSLPVLRSA
jgi:DNA-binding CsgD family transcriptional regulator/PAS domain-containing protein